MFSKRKIMANIFKNTLNTINGCKIIGLKWHRSLGAYLGTVMEPAWGECSNHANTTAWDKEGKQFGIYKNLRAGYNLS